MGGSGERMRYKYLSVSAKKKDCIVFAESGAALLLTFRIPVYAESVLQYFSMLRKIRQALSLNR